MRKNWPEAAISFSCASGFHTLVLEKTLIYWFTGLPLAKLEVTTSGFWSGTWSLRFQWPGGSLPEPSASWGQPDAGHRDLGRGWASQPPSLTPSSLTDPREGGGRGAWEKGWRVSSS